MDSACAAVDSVSGNDGLLARRSVLSGAGLCVVGIAVCLLTSLPVAIVAARVVAIAVVAVVGTTTTVVIVSPRLAGRTWLALVVAATVSLSVPVVVVMLLVISVPSTVVVVVRFGPVPVLPIVVVVVVILIVVTAIVVVCTTAVTLPTSTPIAPVVADDGDAGCVLQNLTVAWGKFMRTDVCV